MKLFAFLVSLFAILLLAGCASNPQTYAGMTYAKLTFDAPKSADDHPTLSGAEVWNGKEMASGHFDMEMDKDKLRLVWDVGDVHAFTGQEARAETEIAIRKETMDAMERIAPAVAGAVAEGAVKGAVKGLVPIP